MIKLIIVVVGIGNLIIFIKCWVFGLLVMMVVMDLIGFRFLGGGG